MTGTVDLEQLPLSVTPASHAFSFTSIHTLIEANGGDDKIFGNDGDDILMGQQGADEIRGGAGNDDIWGGHNVAGGQDTGDRLDGGADNDVVVGDNAVILLTGSSVSPRYRNLSGTVIFDSDGVPQTTGAAQAKLRSCFRGRERPWAGNLIIRPSPLGFDWNRSCERRRVAELPIAHARAHTAATLLVKPLHRRQSAGAGGSLRPTRHPAAKGKRLSPFLSEFFPQSLVPRPTDGQP